MQKTMWDDLEPKTVKPKPKDLSVLGVAELDEYIAALKAEITRAEDVKAAKTAHKASVEGLFKK